MTPDDSSSPFFSNVGIQRVALDQLAPGHVLAEPITDAHGKVLIAAGSSVSADALARLIVRGIASSAVVTVATAQAALPPAEQEAALAAKREQAKARIDHLFRSFLRRNEIHPLMRLVWRYRSESLS